ncbi:DNA-binding response regulator [Candidatus Methylacidiphilum fumarolicum]|uniref:Phosphate regulon transcriptional regulatory protein phoB n=2 Tax=Candidatus Methylacidiphilum fumarolicum TaxID=591154 RepID=I0K0S8_METFB|nr:response regulator [Candidatus Methylacidiphilum fumarolicum]MBW6414027.1 response regulator [Candidatus Methylacidiphilum fumarolicum]TFE66376.1 DNA-binding response regulator [Candidatus Methylacidiphilum fumarolicum]TFE75284.1 DNA-binding response regulator [Candidatus Methylacidiphilum fumarolicum]TFE76104.1 DNA-binding response regulator [Candidatus Methylacidiphilum fumarolicum]TFE77247.1 DNA-binding response regulator [Candidatus Methylacidiphilum fumarolicum]
MGTDKKKKKILVVEDEEDVSELICMHLKAQGFETVVAKEGMEALRVTRKQLPDLIVLDLMIPEFSGIDVCKYLKKDPDTAAIPIVILTAKSDPSDRILGLELGADDYIAKPFSPRELILRIQSVLRRRFEIQSPVGQAEHDDQIRLDPIDKVAYYKKRRIELTPIEFRLLSTLMEKEGAVQTREELLKEVWGYEKTIDTRTIDTHIRRLRDKLGRAAQFLRTVRGIGYRYKKTT